MDNMFNTILQAGIEETLRKGQRFFIEEIKRLVQDCAEAQLDGKETCEKILKYINELMLKESLRRY